MQTDPGSPSLSSEGFTHSQVLATPFSLSEHQEGENLSMVSAACLLG